MKKIQIKKIQLIALLCILGGGMISVDSGAEHIISHNERTIDLDAVIKRLEKDPNLVLPLEREVEILKQLNEFDFGKSLLRTGGVNGYWISYVINKGFGKQLDNSLEDWLLNSCPIVLATQERFKIFQRQLQHYLTNNMVLASIPCGVMDDLLSLDFSKVNKVRLVGVDLDQDALDLASKNAKKHAISNADVTFAKENAWDLSSSNKYDIITSNGLNIYEPDEEKIVALYQQFYKALKPEGILITSFFTPSPKMSKDSPWKDYVADDVVMQQAIFGDVVQTVWQTKRSVYMTAPQMENCLQKAGFKVLEVIYDKQAMFPTIVARKINSQ